MLNVDFPAAPGFVKTEIFDVNVPNVVGPYISTAYAEPLCKWLQYLHWSTQEDRAHAPEVVARQVSGGIWTSNENVCYRRTVNYLI